MKIRKKITSLFLSLLLLLSLTVSVSAADGSQVMAVHFIDVGQGLSVLVQSQGQNLLYDGGDRSHADQVTDYLKKQEVQTIDYLISSHYDEDHLGGLVECLKEFEVVNALGSDYVHTSDLFNEFMNTATANAIIVQYPSVGDTFSFGSGSFTVLSPDGIDPNNSNRNSVAIKLTNGNNSFIFTGDAEEGSEQDMISSGMSLDCDVLCLGHHGSASSTTWDFLSASTPSWAVVSCGMGNQYGHPAAETMGRLSDMEIPVFRTDKQGTIIGVSDGSSISWNTEPCNDYSSGDESQADSSASQASSPQAETPSLSEETPAASQTNSASVWISATGEKYHRIPNCGRMNPDKATQMSRDQAEAAGYEACKKCY